MPERKNLIIDPSFFAHPNAVSSLLRSELSKEYRFVIPTLLYKFISDRNRQGFVFILGRWESAIASQIERTWTEILGISPEILKYVVPCAKVLEELSPEQRSLAEKIDNILTVPESTPETDGLCLEMAKEMIETACVASLIVSVSYKAKNWYNRLTRAIVKRVEDNSTLMKSKEDARNKLKNAGWKGSVLIWLCKHFPIPYIGDAIDTVIILITNGTYRCQNCGKSLWRLPRDIAFCPYCSKPL